MKKLKNYYTHPNTLQHPKHKWIIYPLTITSILTLFLLLIGTLTSPTGTLTPPLLRRFTTARSSIFVEHRLHPLRPSHAPPPPRLAYLISGSKHDGQSLKRTLLALYHPNNRYVVHLDGESSIEEGMELGRFVKGNEVFVRFGNVVMIEKANLVTYRGPTMVANTLHAAAILLKKWEWDWFINLSASDYPLVTQDGKNVVFLAWTKLGGGNKGHVPLVKKIVA